MKLYAKGVRAERELLHFLNFHGFAVMRSASSGGWLSPVDVVAMKKGRVLCFEIKSWAKKPKLDKHHLERFKEFCQKADAFGFLAWYNKKWLFLNLQDAEKGLYEDENWFEMDTLLKAMNI